jgi:hypothetical protein
MSQLRPFEPYHFQANLIWLDGPFPFIISRFHFRFTHIEKKVTPIRGIVFRGGNFEKLEVLCDFVESASTSHPAAISCLLSKERERI